MDNTLPEVKVVPIAERLGRAVASIGTAVLDQFYPPVCLACGTAINAANTLCATCWRSLRPITAPMCPRLGLPFEVSLGPDVLSAQAIADPPVFERARSAVIYNDLARAIVGRLKYADHPELARFCAQLMLSGCHDLLEGDAVLVPVPLHRGRQWRRRYNQSNQLAQALGHLSGLAVESLAVERRRRTRQQVGLTASQRAKNVKGAFAVAEDALVRIRGRRVVLVDDVITTGATVRALTLVLKRAGVEKVDVASFARVVISPEDPI